NHSTTPYLLYVGNAYPHKNLESLLHAYSFFVRLHPDVHLVLAGRNDIFYKRLQKELDEIEVPRENVRFVMNPTDAELAELYRGAALYLFPSKAEGFGLPPLEAMSAGVPVAAARIPALTEILGDAATYFSPDDIEEMVEVMEKALTDESLRTQLVARGHEQIKRYSWSAMAGATRNVYEQIAHRTTQ
ncbi:glycosyltransferase family 1 protein, partial [bacterium]|nr:glycosyltransferase family 1 protein [bacterium]